MAKTFKTIDEALKYIESQIPSLLQRLAIEVRDILKNYVKTEVYERSDYKGDGYGTDFYDRTFQLLNSLVAEQVKKVGNGWEVRIHFDPNRIEPWARRNRYGYNGFNAHMSLDGSTSYAGKSIGEWLVEWWEYGNDNPLWDMKAAQPIEKTKQFILQDKYHLHKITELLKMKGFTVFVS